MRRPLSHFRDYFQSVICRGQDEVRRDILCASGLAAWRPSFTTAMYRSSRRVLPMREGLSTAANAQTLRHCSMKSW